MVFASSLFVERLKPHLALQLNGAIDDTFEHLGRALDDEELEHGWQLEQYHLKELSGIENLVCRLEVAVRTPVTFVSLLQDVVRSSFTYTALPPPGGWLPEDVTMT